MTWHTNLLIPPTCRHKLMSSQVNDPGLEYLKEYVYHSLKTPERSNANGVIFRMIKCPSQQNKSCDRQFTITLMNRDKLPAEGTTSISPLRGNRTYMYSTTCLSHIERCFAPQVRQVLAPYGVTVHTCTDDVLNSTPS